MSIWEVYPKEVVALRTKQYSEYLTQIGFPQGIALTDLDLKKIILELKEQIKQDHKNRIISKDDVFEMLKRVIIYQRYIIPHEITISDVKLLTHKKKYSASLALMSLLIIGGIIATTAYYFRK